MPRLQSDRNKGVLRKEHRMRLVREVIAFLSGALVCAVALGFIQSRDEAVRREDQRKPVAIVADAPKCDPFDAKGTPYFGWIKTRAAYGEEFTSCVYRSQ